MNKIPTPDKDFLLTKSKVFCMAPWVHLYTSPVGDASPCCIAKTCVGSSLEQSLEELINSNGMKQLRLDMLNERYNPACETCHIHQNSGISSSKDQYYHRFNKHFDEVISNTNEDGSLDNFKMRYFDFRFSNICNFKCRTCNSNFSSQWEHEDLQRAVPYAKIYPKNNRKQSLDEIVSHIPHMEYAYFAGGEPLITEEHYFILEEMLRQNKTDIILVYNSNASNFKFKNKDIIGLWQKFSNPIQFYASIDHFGERAEYIRNGTDWGKVESNLLTLNQVPWVNLGLNTVCSIFNYPTLHKFYQYLIDKKIYTNNSNLFGIYGMVSPQHFTAHVLPNDIKKTAEIENNKLIEFMKTINFANHRIEAIQNIINWVNSSNTWDLYKDEFRYSIIELDKVRNEDFTKVFPELASLMD
jgi:Iron-sulfur cluster-binding domain